ncbi:MAG TPA: hypothetical protein VF254_08300 [Gammaproteobacteria bacterium]
MKASQLRDLTREFAAGRIDRQAYVAERRRLIEGIVSGEIEIRYRELEPATRPSEEPRRQRWPTLAAGALVSLLLAALFIHFFGAAPTTPASASTQAVPAPPGKPGVELLARFNQDGQWSATAIDAFEREWNALTPFQQENARRSAEYRQLKHETAERIREQEALLATGKMEALMEAVRLREFGERMGFPPED